MLTGAVLAACLLVPVGEPDRGRLSNGIVLATGLGAVLLATAVAGPPAGSVFAAWTLPLALLAAVAEEALFRRVAWAVLAPSGFVLALTGTSLLFALVHVPLYGWAVFPVDLGAGLLFGWQRWAAGTWTVPAATHAAANLLVVIAR
jgi:membrane protease YdiL (CAAX protease family)